MAALTRKLADYCKMRLLASLFLLKIKLKNFAFYVYTGLYSVLLLAICLHPIILFAALMHFNIIGDLTRNILFLAILALDCVGVFVGGVLVDYYFQGKT
jgi:hypothetical protein